MLLEIRKPYVIFLGDAIDSLQAKVGDGIARWRGGDVVGQLRLPSCVADLGLEDVSLSGAWDLGARTLVIGVANRGGVIPENWLPVLVEAMECGFDIASGLHNRLSDISILRERSVSCGVRLLDVRVPVEDYPVGGSLSVCGRRLLSVGTDCSVGKMFTSLAIERCMRERGISVDFRATGQTGILISGGGVPLDAVVGDFMSGAIESLCPESDDSHWDIIEGQGSLWHPSFSGVSLGLLHGSRADSLVVCHEPTRTHMRGLPHYPIASIEDTILANELLGRRTHPGCRVVGISVNSSSLGDSEARVYLRDLSIRFGIPAVDAYRYGADELVEALL